MAFEDRYFQRAQFPFTPGVPVVFNLNPGLNILRADIIIKATVVISGGTTSGTPIGEGGPVNLIRRIRVIANKPARSRYPAQAPLVNCSPQSLLRRGMIESNGKYVGELGASLLGSGAAGTYNIYLSIPIYFGDSVQKNNVQTALNMNPLDSQGNPVYSAVQVQVELAASIDELFAGSDRTMVVSGMVNYGDIRLGLATDTTPLFQEDHYALIQAPNEEFVDPAMPADGAFTEWLIMAQQGTPGWVLSDAILNRIEAQGNSLNFKSHWQDIRQAMVEDGWYDPSTLSASNPYWATGQFFIDWTHGLLQNSNAASGLQHRMSVNNPSGAGQDRLRIYTRRIFGLA